MRMLPAMLLLPALAGAAFSQSALNPASAVNPPQAERLLGRPAVRPTPLAGPIERVCLPVPLPALQRAPSVENVFPPVPRGLIDTPTALKYRRFLIDVRASQPRSCPAPIAEPAPAAPPQPVAAGPRVARTIALKNVSCLDVHRRLQAKSATSPWLSGTGRGSPDGRKLIVVPEPTTNSLLVIGTAAQIADLQRMVKVVDADAKVDVFEIVVDRVLPNGKKVRISSPRMVVVRGTEGRIEMSQSGGTVLKMSVQVGPIRRAGFVKVYANPPLTAVNDRCFDGRIGLIPPPAPGIAEPITVRPAGWFETIRTVGHTVALKTPPEPLPPVAAACEVRVYSIKDLLDEADRDAGQALATVIGLSVRPDSWSKRGGNGTIAYYRATGSLIVRQTPDVHRRVSELLAQLRTVRGAR